MSTVPKDPTRRQLIAGMAAGAGIALIGTACESSGQKAENQMTTQKMPVVFLPHGGGPWPFVDIGWNLKDADELKAYLESVRKVTPVKPKALLVISAHWEE